MDTIGQSGTAAGRHRQAAKTDVHMEEAAYPVLLKEQCKRRGPESLPSKKCLFPPCKGKYGMLSKVTTCYFICKVGASPACIDVNPIEYKTTLVPEVQTDRHMHTHTWGTWVGLEWNYVNLRMGVWD